MRMIMIMRIIQWWENQINVRIVFHYSIYLFIFLFLGSLFSFY